MKTQEELEFIHLLRRKVRSLGKGTQQEFKGMRSRALVGRKDVYVKKQKWRPCTVCFLYEPGEQVMYLELRTRCRVPGVKGCGKVSHRRLEEQQGCFEDSVHSTKAQQRLATSKLWWYPSAPLQIHLQWLGAEKGCVGVRG